jgi:hypothetical protein
MRNDLDTIDEGEISIYDSKNEKLPLSVRERK